MSTRVSAARDARPKEATLTSVGRQRQRNVSQGEQTAQRAFKKVLILGNLNVGKTTLFNRICGKHSKVSNFPGTSVSIGRGTVSEAQTTFHLIDTPGIDSMMPESEDEKVSRDILIDEQPTSIVVVADGKNLRKSLLLTLQLAEYQIPMILNINMMDEVRQRGIQIDVERLSSLIGVPVTTTVATEGEGIKSFRHALTGARKPRARAIYPAKIESAVSIASKLLKGTGLPSRPVAAALVAGDRDMERYVTSKCGEDVAEQIKAITDTVQSSFPRPLSAVMLGVSLRSVDETLSEVQSISPPARIPFAEKIGEWSRRPLTGLPIAALVILLMYLFVGRFGAATLVGLVEQKVFGQWIVPGAAWLLDGIPFQWIKDAFIGRFGLVSVGLSLAFGVVVPVLATFFFAFGILEDSGYLPRLSILLDRLLRKIGLNGKGVLPLVMGFSCITMAILTTRILETKRERLIATLLLVLGIPCAPVMAVMLVLLSGMSIWASVTVFGIIAAQVVIIGFIAGKVLPGRRSDFILELPPIRIPKLTSLVKKTFWRIWWFIKEAIPMFLLATLVLFLVDITGVLRVVERAAAPVLSKFLGLPAESVQVVIMKMIRKESGAAMLERLSHDGVFDNVQVVVGLLLLAFLLPCLNSIFIMIKERGLKLTLGILAFVMTYALVVGAAVNLICRTFGVTFE